MSGVNGQERFPFLFGGTFIEGEIHQSMSQYVAGFPFLFGGTFIEGCSFQYHHTLIQVFPFLFGGTFIEGNQSHADTPHANHFPSFSEGLSLRAW